MSNNKRNMLKTKFILTSLIGVLAFMIPIPLFGEINIPVEILTTLFSKLTSPIINILILLITLSSTLLSVYVAYNKFRNKKINLKIKKIFEVNYVYLITKIIASVILLMIYFGYGSEIIIGGKTGMRMLELSHSLVAIAISMSFLLPFLTDTGSMEFIGVIAKPIVRPLFKVPADASLDLIASWLGASSAAVILSAEKYRKNYYTKKETAIVMCNFSLVSIPFCMLVAAILNVEKYFLTLYTVVTVIGIILAIITPRIKPLSSLSDEFYSVNYVREEFEVKDGNVLSTAFDRAIEVSKTFNLSNVLNTAISILGSVLLNLLPTVIAWGTIGLILVEYTSIFKIISYPMGVILNMFGVKEAFIAAPATLVGFIDMFIPALLCSNIQSVETRFIIAALSLIQIIYVTEVGSIIIQTDIGVNFKKLLMIFLQRTIISLLFIITISKIIF